MAENQRTYGLPNIIDLLSQGIGQAQDLTTGITSGIYGGASDVSGMGSELLGLPPEIAQFFRNLADDSYQKSSEAFRSILDPKTLSQREIERRLNTPQRDLIEKQLIDPDKMMLFEPPDPVSDLGERLSRLGNLSATSPKVPPGGRPQTIPEEKEESVADLQEEVKADEQLFGREKEAFRKEEEGRLQGTPATEAFKDAMQDFMDKAGKGKATKGAGTGGGRSLEDYKKEFAKATGINIEGGPDKSNFLMALGLGLMQNRAGKGFDISKILTSVGEATEKAMPKLEEAKKQFKAEQLAAGEFALKAQAKDRATAAAAQKKLNETKQYFVIPTDGKGGLTPADYLNSVDKGRLMTFSNAQLNNLRSDESFNNNFTVVSAEKFYSLTEAALETPEAKELYLTKNPRDINLLGDEDQAGASLFNIRVYDPNINTNPDGTPKMIGDGKNQYKALALAAQDLQKAKDKFIDGLGLAEGANVFQFTLDKAESLAGAFGINVSEGANNTEKLQLFLKKLQAQNAKAILGEAGKTISDADRALVASIVGDRTIFTNPDLLVEKVNQLFNDIIVKKERQIYNAIETLDGFTKRNVAQILYSQDPLSDSDQIERLRLRKKYGLD